MTLLVVAGDDDAYFHLEKAELHLRNAESKLFFDDVELAKKVRKLREELSEILVSCGRDER